MGAPLVQQPPPQNQQTTVQEQTQQTTITLTKPTCIAILVKYVEFLQTRGGIFQLEEAAKFRECMDTLAHYDNKIPESEAIELLIQGCNKGQRLGGLNLNDAKLLSKVIEYLNFSDFNLQSPPQPSAVNTERSVER